ncbi:hypothetical protein [Modestobacter sp. VKM Ac-2984]|uniref:hypothetical protein n=1 Tax=Modestobacter sp. VKM Ac-2984 TaxID=3004138 RepID=UPI0022A9FDA2|nr:hypothetical protein [Modestobacter sp. VKM Ac-2984]MCZ2816498.1 hypothetical protein [Modestobacter sp. VKM Ac-2984]
MHSFDQDQTRSHMTRRMAEAEESARARRLITARRWARKAERASQRAARASSAVW